MIGSCLCGAIRYQADGDALGVNCCHCSQCQKASGTAFATNAAYPRAAFCIVSGAEHLADFESSPGKRRHFCGRCGSPLYSWSQNAPETVYVRIGTADGAGDLRPDIHIHVASKASWYEIADDLPQRREQEDLWF